MMMSHSEIVRRPDFAGGGITEEERRRMDAHTKVWIERIMHTGHIERDKIEPAIRDLYRVADLPEPLAVVIVPSPLVMALAGGIAAAWWAARDTGAIRDATTGATRDDTAAWS